MPIIGLSMAVLPCRAEEDVEAGSAALRVDWPVYPRRAEHNTIAEGGIEDGPRLRADPLSLSNWQMTQKTAFDLHNKIGSDVFIAASTMAG